MSILPSGLPLSSLPKVIISISLPLNRSRTVIISLSLLEKKPWMVLVQYDGAADVVTFYALGC